MNETLNSWARQHPVSAFFVFILRAVLVTFGLILMVAAVPIGIVTPVLPVGAILFFFGLVIVAAASKTLHAMITRQLRRWPWLWKRMGRFFGEKPATE